MGGGDLNAKKAWHPNTLKNQERVWKAEQAAAEEKKRIVELERERQLERDRADLNKLARNNLGISGPGNDDRLHWMYEKPDKKVQQEEYLLGRAIDKNHDQAGKSEADEIPAVSRRVVGSSMLSISGDTQVDLARKMREDPLLLVKERERAARAALLNNPVQRARLTELLRKEQENKKESKSKKEKKKGKDLDSKLAEKLQAISGTKKVDLATLLASGDSSSESSDEEPKKKKKKKAKKKSKSKKKSLQDSESEEERTSKMQTKKEERSKKRKSDDTESEGEKKKKKHSKKDSRKHKHDIKRRIDDSDDEGSTSKKKKRNRSVEKGNNNSQHKRGHDKNESDAYSSDEQKDYRKSKAEREFRDRGKDDRYLEDYKLKSQNDHYSKDEHESKRNKYSKSERQSKDTQYYSNKHVSNDDKDTKYVKRGEDDNRKLGYRREASSIDDRHSGRNYKEKDKDEPYRKYNSSEKEHRGYKRSGISEDEKAAKLAEMAAAGAEREKQRERRVAQQLAEKEKADQPSYSRSRSGNVINQLPDSLESRIHSNRHYIQRDQRHMNEHFARR